MPTTVSFQKFKHSIKYHNQILELCLIQSYSPLSLTPQEDQVGEERAVGLLPPAFLAPSPTHSLTVMLDFSMGRVGTHSRGSPGLVWALSRAEVQCCPSRCSPAGDPATTELAFSDPCPTPRLPELLSGSVSVPPESFLTGLEMRWKHISSPLLLRKDPARLSSHKPRRPGAEGGGQRAGP